MVNSSLAYEILVYINSFYFGLFGACELGTLILKSVTESLPYKPGRLETDAGVLVAVLIIEAVRIYLGRKGSLADRNVPVMFSVLLTIPSMLGVTYLLAFQKIILKIEYIWCALMLMFQTFELLFAIMFILTMCREPSYD